MPSPFKRDKKSRRRYRKHAATWQAVAAELRLDFPEMAARLKRIADLDLRIGQAKRKRRKGQ
jgi:hypothetical protein